MATSDEDKDRDEDEARDEGSEGDDDGSAPGDGGDDEEAAAEEEKEADAKPAKASPAKAPARPAEPPRPPPSAGLGKSVSLFVMVVGGLSLLMVVLGAERGGGPAAPPKWNDGQTVEVDITLVSTDRTNLACASGTDIKGLHCGFESPNKRWTKGDPNDDKKTLRPYSTTNSINMLAAGVWSEPILEPSKVPDTRFSIKCKFTVAGKMPRADVRWKEGEGWNNVTDWYTGHVSDCKMGTIQN